MKKVKCVKSFDEPFFLLLALLAGTSVPVVGGEYTVVRSERCRCGKHDRLYLLEVAGGKFGWDARHFVEISDKTADQIMNEAERELEEPAEVEEPVLV
jgi:hypothetical protein